MSVITKYSEQVESMMMQYTTDVLESSIRHLATTYNFSYEDAMSEIQRLDHDIQPRIHQRKKPSAPRPRQTEEEKLAKQKAKEDAKQKKIVTKLFKIVLKDLLKFFKQKAKEEEKLAKQQEKKKAKPSKPIKHKYAVPFLGTILPDQCQGIKLNYGLHTQCHGSIQDGETYCTSCLKATQKNNDIHPFGNINERLEEADKSIKKDFYDNKGNKSVQYMAFLKKYHPDATKEQVQSYFAEHNITIPEMHWDEPEEQKQRGRPKKKKNLTSSSDEDLAAALSNAVKEEDTEDENDDDDEKTKKDTNSPETESSITSLSSNAKPKTMEDTTEDDEDEKKEDNDDESDDDDEDEPLKVSHITIEGKAYLISKTNELYDIGTQDHIGRYIRKTKKIIPFNEESDDEEE